MGRQGRAAARLPSLAVCACAVLASPACAASSRVRGLASQPAWAQKPLWWIVPPDEVKNAMFQSWPRPAPMGNPTDIGGMLTPGPGDPNNNDPSAPQNAALPRQLPGMKGFQHKPTQA